MHPPRTERDHPASHSFATITSQQFTFGYDPENRLLSAATTGVLATYAYDPLSRRTNLAYGNTAAVAYTYTNAGDLLTLNHNMSGTSNDPHYSFAYTNAHQLASEANSDGPYKVPGAHVPMYTPCARAFRRVPDYPRGPAPLAHIVARS